MFSLWPEKHRTKVLWYVQSFFTIMVTLGNNAKIIEELILFDRNIKILTFWIWKGDISSVRFFSIVVVVFGCVFAALVLYAFVTETETLQHYYILFFGSSLWFILFMAIYKFGFITFGDRKIENRPDWKGVWVLWYKRKI